MNMNNKKTISNHDTAREAAFFEEFIENCFIELGCEIIRDKVFDFYLPNGFPSKSNEPCFVELKYSSQHPTDDYVRNKDIKYTLYVISFEDEIEDVFLSGLNQVVFLGKSYIENLIKQFPGLWWNFVSSCSKTPEVKADEENEVVYIQDPPIAVKKTKLYLGLDYKHIDELSNINAASFKRDRKKERLTSLIIGNGVSIPFGSDTWKNVSNYLFDYLYPKYVDNPDKVRLAIGDTTYSCTSISKAMIDEERYYTALHNCIYRKYEKSMLLSKGTLINEIVASKVKNPLINLITYNYDNFIEMEYYHQTKKDLVSVVSCRKDNKTNEPKIKHVHGFLPYNAISRRRSIVLTQEEYYNAYSDGSWIVETQKKALDGLCLFVGSSMSDQFQMGIIDSKQKDFYRKHKDQNLIWKCYCLMCLEGLTEKDKVAVYNYFIRKGVYLIFVNSFNQLAPKYAELFK